MSERLTDLAAQTQILLAAVDADRNVRRSYAISRSRDLFGWTLVTCQWGRVGQPGQLRTHAFAAENAAVTFTRRQLARRASARRRIGVDYLVISSAPDSSR